MKRNAGFVFVALLGLLSLAMGGMDESGVVTVPRTDKNYTVELVDQADVSMKLERFSFDGQTYLSGRFGKSEISIDFDKIDSVTFLLSGNEVKAHVRLNDGELIEMMMDKKKPCFGASSFANVRIEVQDIKKIRMRL